MIMTVMKGILTKLGEFCSRNWNVLIVQYWVLVHDVNKMQMKLYIAYLGKSNCILSTYNPLVSLI